MSRCFLFVVLFCMVFPFNSLMAETSHQGHDHAVMSTDKPTDKPAIEIPQAIVEVTPEKCPIMGGEINKAVSSIYQGHLYYFCCQGCVSSFEADPAQYLEKFKDAATRELKVTNVDGKCPVSGLEASLKFYKINEEAATITFYHDQKSLESAGE